MRFIVLNFQNSEKFKPSGSGQYDFVNKFGDLSSSFVNEESLLDANSEKEQVHNFSSSYVYYDVILSRRDDIFINESFLEYRGMSILSRRSSMRRLIVILGVLLYHQMLWLMQIEQWLTLKSKG